jgi:hypothetical protein
MPDRALGKRGKGVSEMPGRALGYFLASALGLDGCGTLTIPLYSAICSGFMRALLEVKIFGPDRLLIYNWL